MCNGIKAKQGGKAIETENGGCFPEEKNNKRNEGKKCLKCQIPVVSLFPKSQNPIVLRSISNDAFMKEPVNNV